MILIRLLVTLFLIKLIIQLKCAQLNCPNKTSQNIVFLQNVVYAVNIMREFVSSNIVTQFSVKVSEMFELRRSTY